MSGVSATLVVMSAASGLWAAYKWYQASQVQVGSANRLLGQPGDTTGRLDTSAAPMPGTPDPAVAMKDQVNAVWEATRQMTQLSRLAALWTAISLATFALSVLAELAD